MCNLFVVEDDPSLFIRKMGKTILSKYIITKYALKQPLFCNKMVQYHRKTYCMCCKALYNFQNYRQ